MKDKIWPNNKRVKMKFSRILKSSEQKKHWLIIIKYIKEFIFKKPLEN
jgi:hypothetical protein